MKTVHFCTKSPCLRQSLAKPPQEMLIFEFHHGEFVLEDLSVTSNVVELFAQFPAFGFFGGQPVLKGDEVDGFFLCHSSGSSASESKNATPALSKLSRIALVGRSSYTVGWGLRSFPGEKAGGQSLSNISSSSIAVASAMILA